MTTAQRLWLASAIIVLGGAILVLVLATCRGRGGSEAGPDARSTTSAPLPRGAVLGSRAMPGSSLSVSTETAIAAGQPASVVISAPELPAGAVLRAAIGTRYEGARAMAVTALGGNRWRASIVLPDPLPAKTAVLVSITMPDGAVLESGIADFILKR